MPAPEFAGLTLVGGAWHVRIGWRGTGSSTETKTNLRWPLDRDIDVASRYVYKNTILWNQEHPEDLNLQRIELSAGESVCREIWRRFASLDMPPITPSGEEQCADSLNMSATSLQEALARLSAEGLADLRANAGTMDLPIRPEAARIARFVRGTMKLRILQIAVKSSGNQAPVSMGQAIADQKLAVARSDVDDFFPADDKMDRALCGHGGREAVWFAMSDAKRHMDRERQMSLQDAGPSDLLEDRRQAVAAIKFGNVSAACDLKTVHLCRTIVDLDRFAAKHPDYLECQDEGGAQTVRKEWAQ